VRLKILISILLLAVLLLLWSGRSDSSKRDRHGNFLSRLFSNDDKNSSQFSSQDLSSEDDLDNDQSLTGKKLANIGVPEEAQNDSALPPSPPTPTAKPTLAVLPTSVPSTGLIGGDGESGNSNPGREFLHELAKKADDFDSTGKTSGLGLRSSTVIGNLAEPQAIADEQQLDEGLVLSRLSGQARGYTMLYLMQPQARAVVEEQVSTLLQSQITQTYLGVLVDGTFSKDYPYLESVVQRLSSEGRTLTLVVYLSNGSTMRNFNVTPITALFAQIDPILFRDLIRQDRNIRNRFVRIAREARGIFDFNKRTNPANSNIAVVMLEDNLDRSSYRTMRSLAAAEVGPTVEFYRNPCVGCYDGNDGDPLGNHVEEHTMKGFAQLGTGDGISLDGLGFRYSNDEATRALSIDQLTALINDSAAKGIRYFGLWRFGWQGVNLGQVPILPERRAYSVSTPEQSRIEIHLLRHGLNNGQISGPTP